MIVGLGTDIVETGRVARELERGPWLDQDGIFTLAEIAYCSSAKSPAQRYAACFAAKEATLKALGTEVEDLGLFQEVEVRFDSPLHKRIILHGRAHNIATELGIRNLQLSIAVARESVGAMVILES